MSRSLRPSVRITALLAVTGLSSVVVVSQSTVAVDACLLLLALILLAVEMPVLAASAEDDAE